MGEISVLWAVAIHISTVQLGAQNSMPKEIMEKSIQQKSTGRITKKYAKSISQSRIIKGKKD